MRPGKVFHRIQPYLAVIAVILIGSLLAITISFTEFDKEWVTFLMGVLMASVIGMVSRSSRAEWLNARRAEQLTLMKDKLEQESLLRKKADEEHQQALSLLQQTERAFGRLIPHQLLALMGRNNILEVQLGDQFERKLSVMCADIRNFTTLSESLTPQENFNFLNSYLAQMAPIISTHRGIIDKFIGDSIMALYTQGADDALSGAIHMLKNLEEYNAVRAREGHSPIQIGIGLNTGLAMIGTVGGTSRMDSTVIGDVVNLSSRIESATKTYFSPLLISQNTLYDLQVPGKYDIRFLDRIRVKGKTQAMSLYEVFDNDSIKVRDGKRVNKARFEAAIACYHLKEIPRAIELLNQCLETTPKDIPARIYLSRCEQYQATGQHFSTGELNNHLGWRKEYQTNIDVIDQLHRQLFGKVNELIYAFVGGDTKAVRIIFGYLASHFAECGAEEEELMSCYHYPFIDDHRHEHRRFREEFMVLREEADSESYDMSLLSFRAQLLLFDWFAGHISHSDRHAARHINKQIKPASRDVGSTTLQFRKFISSPARVHQAIDLPLDDTQQRQGLPLQ